MSYSDTVHLPKTSFSMKADLPKREPLMLDFWNQNKIYEKIVKKREGKIKYILHDGPPYANGHIHMGHALNKILKDMIVKFKTLSGFYAPYVPGWDCHGLPIEHQLMKDLKKDKHSVDILDFRKKAADFALKWVQIQKEEFKRLGIFGDWENPYLTLTPNYETLILKVFRELVKEGYVYRSLKPVQWCWHCETALAEAEVEYEEKESTAVYVKIPLKFTIPTDPYHNEHWHAIIWTTTPWTLPANVGIMLGYSVKYSLVFIKEMNERWIIAEKLVKKVLEEKLKMNPSDYEILRPIQVAEITSATYERIFIAVNNEQRDGEVVHSADQVSEEEGTGIVHIAPGHGYVDYMVGHVDFGLHVLSPVDDSGKFSKEVNYPELEGLFVLNKGNKKIVEMLKDKKLLVREEKIPHSYPHCWRCKNPVIFRATYQWFLKVGGSAADELRSRMLYEIEEVKWIPAYGKDRIRGMVKQRPDWCLSRQRLWGTPIPIFYCQKCGDPLLDDQAINMVEEAVGLDGSDIWFKEEPQYFLKNLDPFKCQNPKCGGDKFIKENDILDVWFDSGSSYEAVLKGDGKTASGKLWNQELAYPASLYLEGSDQHRGWFQSSLIPSVALNNKAPYDAVLTHGFIVDGEGKKMSKSLGNVIAPEDILKEYGADILRLWVAASDYREDIRLSKDILKGVAENYKKIRNTFRYLIGNISDYDHAKDKQPLEKMLEIDRWALMRLYETMQACKKAYEAYEFHRVAVTLIEFCVIDCSSFYFDILKDRLYTYGKNSPARRSAQTVLHLILSHFLRAAAPILSFTSEEVWQLGLQNGHWPEESVFLADFPDSLPAEWKDEALKERWSQILRIREMGNLNLEAARRAGTIGSSLEAKLIFSGGTQKEKELLKSMAKELAMIFIVSQAEMNGGGETLEIAVQKAAGTKCGRCWRYDETVGRNSAHPELCSRCLEAI